MYAEKSMHVEQDFSVRTVFLARMDSTSFAWFALEAVIKTALWKVYMGQSPQTEIPGDALEENDHRTVNLVTPPG